MLNSQKKLSKIINRANYAKNKKKKLVILSTANN